LRPWHGWRGTQTASNEQQDPQLRQSLSDRNQPLSAEKT
jgi:hypothetical protein